MILRQAQDRSPMPEIARADHAGELAGAVRRKAYRDAGRIVELGRIAQECTRIGDGAADARAAKLLREIAAISQGYSGGGAGLAAGETD